MDEENVTMVQEPDVDAVAENTTVAEDDPQEAVRKPREKKRKPQELDEVSPASMSQAECVSYIKYCREQILLLQNKNKEMDVTCQKAFTMFKQADENYKQLVTNVDAMVRELNVQTNCFQRNIDRLCKQGVKA